VRSPCAKNNYSKRCELVKLCHINRSGPVFLRHTVHVVPETDLEAVSRSFATAQLGTVISLCISGIIVLLVVLLFLRYSTSNNSVPLKSGLAIIQDR